MKIIVGLGNPGVSFEGTRHNLGFAFVEKLAIKLNLGSFKEKANGLLASGIYQDEKVILLKSQTFMNDSGEAVAYFANYFKVAPVAILVIYDDITLPLGKVRFRDKGSSGGHNGIKSIIRELREEHFPRIKVGIGHDQNVRLDHWVVGKFSTQELHTLTATYEEVASLVINWLAKEVNN